jgi:hypothetical protein
MLPSDRRRVRISISDPWDFYSENGPFALGHIVDLNDDPMRPEFIVELDAPLRSGSLQASEVYARFRSSDGSIERLLAGELVGCNFSNVRDWKKHAPEVRMGFIGGMQLIDSK